jgi:hypothetical protein
MKPIVFFFSFLIFKSCKGVNKSNFNTVSENKETNVKNMVEMNQIQEETPIVIYDSHTRGYHYTFTVYETYATVIKEYKGEPVKVDVSDKEIKELKEILKQISEKDISSYEAPTKKRHFDGAPHTSISIFKRGEKYSSQTFDGGFPPKGLEILVNKVLSLHSEK